MKSVGFHQLKNPVRIITAASLFDGHDASINIFRRMLQDAGAEVIHLGHNRSVMDIVTAALQEGAQGICLSSYQGGHMEYFKYMRDLLVLFGAPYVRIYGGGGGVIVHDEKSELEAYGISRIFHPDDGRRLGLDGIIADIMVGCDFDLLAVAETSLKGFSLKSDSRHHLSETVCRNRVYDLALGLATVAIEKNVPVSAEVQRLLKDYRPSSATRPMVVGLTGTGGAGKSSLIDELAQRFLNMFPQIRVGIFCVDPSKRKTGGALLGDRIRMNSLAREGTYMRSLASRGSGREISATLPDVLTFSKTQAFDVLIAETSGIGQGDVAITELADLSLYVMTSEFGAQSQLEKIDMIDFADLIAINKADRRGSLDALRDVRKQYRRSRKLFHEKSDESLPVFLTQASHFNDEGVNHLFFSLCDLLAEKSNETHWSPTAAARAKVRSSAEQKILPPEKQNYLANIVNSVRDYKSDVREKAVVARELGAVERVKALAHRHHAAQHPGREPENPQVLGHLDHLAQQLRRELQPTNLNLLEGFESLKKAYSGSEFSYQVRGKEIRQPLVAKSLSGLPIRRVVVPKLEDWGDRLEFLRLENVPGQFPFTAGVFELKRNEEDPKRQFAGEGTPDRTNRRFHYLCANDKAKRLSTAFDSVTLYGQDPDERPDIYGKVGESGVSICTLDDIKILYRGFDLTDPLTSVSMTINGPAPMMLAFFLNAAIDREIEKEESKRGRKLTAAEFDVVAECTLQTVRGTVQADILKEDQAQNTCIFSTDFALKLMGDIQEFFISKKVRNFYSVSISGYHIAEAGANPISQLAFTLANGFTYVEYYLSRGMKIDDFAPNLSFFFSNGLDPEYSVIGRVARRIWAIAMKDLYGANERSQKLKYHIQTSGRSLHAQEIAFNDIRTTLQALIAIYDNCNSLHTNAYDEAITTPTEESVRRAMAIQMIINREFGVAKNENPNQGSYFLEELTDLVEEAVLDEFLRINQRGGVLGAMETQYQRSQIQEESLYYERLKHSGEFPIIGVNTYVDPKTLSGDYVPVKIEMARATPEEKKHQLGAVRTFWEKNSGRADAELEKLKAVALKGENVFAQLMVCARYCSLGQMSKALYEVGGQYRRSV